jgi:hypothetical protein
MLLKNKINNLRGFVHPGENNIISECHGKDVPRYIYGGLQLEYYDVKAFTQRKLAGEMFG